jgi:hypothetical protein
MAAHKKVDYERIEPDWRAGLKSPEQLASEYTEATGIPVSRPAIIKHFKNLGIERDLKAKIKAKADAMVAASMVTGKVTTETIATEKAIVDKGATDLAVVQITHRKDIGRSRSLVMSLLAELEAHTDGVGLLEQLAEIMYSPDDKGQDKRNELFNKVISLSGRVSNVKALMDSLKTTIGLEREAYGLDDKKLSGTATGDISITF